MSHQSNNNNNSTLLATIQTLPKAVRNLIAGGLAGMIAKSFVAPIDRIKILYQVTSAQFRLRDVPKVAYSIIEKEGWSALWKGNTATMIRVFPYSGIQFMVFDYCKTFFLLRDNREGQHHHHQLIEKNNMNNVASTTSYADVAGKRHGDTRQNHRTIDNTHNNNTSQHHDNDAKGGLSPIDSLISGMAAGSISVLCTYPLDLARAQLAVLRKKKKPKDMLLPSSSPVQSKKTNIDKLGIGSTSQSSRKGIGYVLSNGFQQGGLRGLYRGITPTVLGILPYSGTAFTINEQAKLKITRIMQREPTTIERLQCGALSGLFAQTLTYPLEVTRRRMQTIGIVPTSGSESAAVNFTGVSQLKPSMDELPAERQQQRQRLQTELPSQQQQQKPITPSQSTTTTTANATTTTTTTSPQQKHPLKPPSMMKTMSHLLEEQGLRGFFKGVSMNWVKGPIAFSISFTAFDTIQGWIETESEKEKKRISGVQRRMTNKMERRITNHEDGD